MPVVIGPGCRSQAKPPREMETIADFAAHRAAELRDPQRDERLADDVLLRLTQPQVRRERQRGDQLGEPDGVARAGHPHGAGVCNSGLVPHDTWAGLVASSETLFTPNVSVAP